MWFLPTFLILHTFFYQLIQDNIPLPAPAGRVPLLQAAQATGQAKQDPGRTPKKNFPQGIRRIPVENAEEAVRWI